MHIIIVFYVAVLSRCKLPIQYTGTMTFPIGILSYLYHKPIHIVLRYVGTDSQYVNNNMI